MSFPRGIAILALAVFWSAPAQAEDFRMNFLGGIAAVASGTLPINLKPTSFELRTASNKTVESGKELIATPGRTLYREVNNAQNLELAVGETNVFQEMETLESPNSLIRSRGQEEKEGQARIELHFWE